MLAQNILLTIYYYNLSGYPLTLLEVTKFLFGSSKPRPQLVLEQLDLLIGQKRLKQWRGFYFLPGQRKLVWRRLKIQKLAIGKRKRLKKILRGIRFIPFLRAIFLSGSFNIDNAGPNSDFDFLVIVQKKRLWLCRFFLSLYVWLLGWKRTGQKTSNRVCLNCFMTQDQLKITSQIKPHDRHSAQEYARLLPLFGPGSLLARFQRENSWLRAFVGRYPWPTKPNFLQIKNPRWVRGIKKTAEQLLDILGARFWESWLGRLQKRRIRATGPQDQIYCSDHCLMLHPSSKAFFFLRRLEKIRQKLIL
ncbi:MAG: hypothetical protein COU85_00530 [Candidatus Portnoybacteria bacterium CG10_big_fil_rev_8_21_14_0_10_44_7]|uniref:Polymerase nucleotidyl transferase domain-containing protein n=1 Tax=Candidatus Portnoybacteria bacterium CG10_big_fil_rev_8_21_14_0_10_44_7 TaxID=1974816 RepID=A0A2M8KJD2_9BACT|nr:MAG: hypothetical protein COU85_00530 [Candidatus Portnoybacteria bacterium CG10_big_fil_rev_8_21_14_0_10_44_7]